MGYTSEQLFGQAVRKRLIRLVRDHAGMFPGEDLVDLGSVDGFLGEGMARKAPTWYVFSRTPPTGEPGNLEAKPMELPELPFPTESMAAVVGAFLEAPFEPWSDELAEEILRVLVPKGRVLFLIRGPSPRAPEVERGLPETALAQLKAAGLKRGGEHREMHLLDGSEVLLLEGTKPW